MIELVCLDMAGTTVADDGVVEKAFTAAAGEVGLTGSRFDDAMAVVRETMGQSKIEVFRRILGDEAAAQQGNAAFERAYGELLDTVAALPGAVDVLHVLRARGRKVCLTTGFAPVTRDALIAHLAWAPLVNLALSPADAGRGRPFPDMIQLAARRLGVTDPSAVAVAGDTPSDVAAGLAAGASIVAGVLTGTGTREELAAAGATHVLGTIADLPPLLR